MAKRLSTFRRKTRYKLQKARSKRGKISLRDYLSEYKVGERVILRAEPAIQEGFFHPRYEGRVGFVTKKLGSCYEVMINDFGKEKKLIVHPVHLKRC
ncbi:MAG TPA: 50S ribosomal protein L21e [Candidatus Nanoarchaeia archaeon]|nr:50S ribosomal protein L21e [Candidatus Nanoarchaeia archaeon]